MSKQDGSTRTYFCLRIFSSVSFKRTRRVQLVAAISARLYLYAVVGGTVLAIKSAGKHLPQRPQNFTRNP